MIVNEFYLVLFAVLCLSLLLCLMCLPLSLTSALFSNTQCYNPSKKFDKMAAYARFTINSAKSSEAQNMYM